MNDREQRNARIRDLAASGLSPNAIAATVGCSRTTVRVVLNPEMAARARAAAARQYVADPEACRRRSDESKARLQAVTAREAVSSGDPWTPAERAVACDPGLTVQQAALRLGRTRFAVTTIRRRAAQPAVPEGMKRCGCGIHEGDRILPVAEFDRDPSLPGGLSTRCKQCVQVQNAARWQARADDRERRGLPRTPPPKPKPPNAPGETVSATETAEQAARVVVDTPASFRTVGSGTTTFQICERCGHWTARVLDACDCCAGGHR